MKSKKSKLTEREMQLLEEFARRERDIKRVDFPLKAHRPKIIRNQSREQRVAEHQSPNSVHAVYVPESRWNVTPILEEGAFTTREVGPNDRYSDRRSIPAKSTNTANGDGNKTRNSRRRYAGGGSNRKSLAELLKEYE
jgi:hypothetical protein